MTDHSSETVASVVGSITGAKQYRPYSAYKDSGVEWLGKIPTNWEVTENRWLFRESDSRSGASRSWLEAGGTVQVDVDSLGD